MANVVPFLSGPVKGVLHQPDTPPDAGIVLTHGAGSNCQSPLLVAIAECFADSGVTVLRYDLPFRQRRRVGPPFPASAAEDREGLRQAVTELRSLLPGRIFLGGHSYGGRQASMVAAEDPKLAEGLLLLSYPLHPPKKPNDLRTNHFGNLRTPALFVHGTNDPFGTVEELHAAMVLIPARTTLVQIPRAGHELLKGRFEIAKLVVEPFNQMMRDA